MISRFNIRRAGGFTLVEVLVSTVILAFGLLGLAGLQTLSLKDNQDAFLYSQATAMAYEMSDRIKVNADAWKGAIPTALTTCTGICDSAAHTCTASLMAQYDYCYWKKTASARLVNNVNAIVEISPIAGGVCTGTSSSRCLTLTWTPGHQNPSNTASKFQLEVRP